MGRPSGKSMFERVLLRYGFWRTKGSNCYLRHTGEHGGIYAIPMRGKIKVFLSDGNVEFEFKKPSELKRFLERLESSPFL